MEKINITELEQTELLQYSGGTFAYDVGAVLGFIGRANSTLGLPYAIAIWNYQYSE